MSQINIIYEALLNRKERVCHRSELLGQIQEYKRRFKSKIHLPNTIKYLSRHKYLKRIFLGYYYINSVDERKRAYSLYEDKELLFIVLNKLGIRWYLGLNSALYLTGKIWQIPTVLHILNNRFSGERRILGRRVKFFKIKETLFFGLIRFRTRNKIEFYGSNPAKTFLDLVYLKKSDKLSKGKQVKSYLKHYPKWVGRK